MAEDDKELRALQSLMKLDPREPCSPVLVACRYAPTGEGASVHPLHNDRESKVVLKRFLFYSQLTLAGSRDGNKQNNCSLEFCVVTEKQHVECTRSNREGGSLLLETSGFPCCSAQTILCFNQSTPNVNLSWPKRRRDERCMAKRCDGSLWTCFHSASDAF